MTDSTDLEPRRGEHGRGAGRGKGHRPPHPALTDQLTGIPNRLHFYVIYEVVFELGDRGVALTLLTLELDDFHRYEQEEGEGAGLEALKRFGMTLGQNIRKTDLVARADRGRFVMLLMDSNLQGGLLAADRLGDILADFVEETGLTFSTGVASFRQGMTHPDDLLDASARALKLAQDAGGDTVKIPADAEG